MGTKKISYFEKIMKKESNKYLKEIIENKYNMYAVNSQKAARNILKRRRKKK